MNMRYDTLLELIPRSHVYAGLCCCSENLVNNFGFSDEENGFCELSKNGFSMWLKKGAPASLEFELEGFLPIGRLLVWNYNRADDTTDYTPCGMKKIRVYHSIDGETWTRLGGEENVFTLAKASAKPQMPASNLANSGVIDFGGVTAKFIKIEPLEKSGEGNYDESNDFDSSFGLAKLRLYTGRGIAVQKNERWTNMLSHRDGWAGSDGIISYALDGRDNIYNPGPSFFTFGDTITGSRDETGKRSADTAFINNSGGFLRKGFEDKSIEFYVPRNEDGRYKSMFEPSAKELGLEKEGSYFWMQDGFVCNGKLYLIPLIVSENLQEVEGYQFSIDGIAMLSVDIKDGKIDFNSAVQKPAPLSHTFSDGSTLYFGAAVFCNTETARASKPDGNIYIYGYRSASFQKNLYVCRVLESEAENLSAYRFYTGRGWSDKIEDSVKICDNVSCEMSVSEYFGKLHQGELFMVFQDYVNSPIVACRTAQSPVGPFSEKRPLYDCPEPKTGRAIYAYNAKAHPHLSSDGTLFVSYNVNTCSFDMNLRWADIYSPRIVTLTEITD